MKKKLLLLFFALVLILSAFSLTAYAAVIEVDTIAIENLHAPFAGDTPDYNIDLSHSGLVCKQSINSAELVVGDTLVNGVAWYEVQQINQGSTPNYKVMKKGETFELGKKYCVRIFVMPVTISDRQFVFANSVGSKIYEMSTDTEGMTNYKTGKVITPTGNRNNEYKVVELTYECAKKSIVSVEITGLKIPKAGEYPDNDCNVLTEGVYANGAVTWVHKTGEDAYGNGHYESWDYDQAFVAGETYKYSIWLRTDYVNGYWFRTNVNGENIADVMVNGIVMGDENICDTWDVNYVRGIEHEYYVASNIISNVDIVGLSYPVAGMQPDFEAYPTTAGYDITEIFWIDETVLESVIASGKHYAEAMNKAKLTKDDGKTFIAGHSYRVCIEVEQQQNYEIAYDPMDEDILCYNATVNGKDAVEGSGRRGEKASFVCSFGEPLLQLISKIDITGVDAPVAGGVPDYEAVCGDDSYKIVDIFWMDETEKADLIASGMTSAQAANQSKLTKDNGKTFKADHKYKVVFEVEPGENYEIDYDEMNFLVFSSTVNGFYAVSDNSSYRHENGGVSYEFAHTCNFVKAAKAEPACDATGKEAYYKCSCGIYAEDSLGKTVIADINSWGILPATGKHTYTNACDKDCNVCSATRTPAAHAEVKVPGKAATCTKTGLTDGKKCSVCGKVTVAQKTIEKKSHTYKTTTTKATLKKNGKQVTKCTVCGDVKSSKTIYYPKSIKLSATSYTYNGKTKKPTVTVKDSKGKTVSKDYYTVKYASGRKNPGKYTVTVTFKGKYSGTKKLSFTIKPAKATLSKVSAGSKQLTATWKTVTAVTGYEVQASTSSKFTSKTTKKATVKSAKTKKTTIKKLTKGKKYYVRVRAYKTVDGKKIYGAWSAVKSVKVK